MHHEFHPARIDAMYVCLLIVLLYALQIRSMYWSSGLKPYLSFFRDIPLAIVSQNYRPVRTSTWLALVAFATAIMPLWFAVLPMSRRLAKVQWLHIWRIALYSFVPIVLFVILDALQPFVMDLFGVASPARSYNVWLWSFERGRLYAATAGIPLFLLVWWSFAIHSYLRMPRAMFIAAFMLLAAMLSVGLLAAIGTLLSGI